jgi:hypothetical protein
MPATRQIGMTTISGSQDPTSLVLKMRLNSASAIMSDATTTKNQASGRGKGLRFFMSCSVHKLDSPRR